MPESLFKVDNEMGSGKTITEIMSRCDGGPQSKKWTEVLAEHTDSSCTLHHLVPWETLQRILIVAIRRSWSGKGSLLDAIVKASHPQISQPVGMLGDAIWSLKEKLQNTAPGEELKAGEKYNVGAQAPQDVAERIYALVHHWCWMPGNLFTGSSSRLDDPGSDGFDFPPGGAFPYADRNSKSSPALDARVRALFKLWKIVSEVDNSKLPQGGTSSQVELPAWKIYRVMTSGFGSVKPTRTILTRIQAWCARTL